MLKFMYPSETIAYKLHLPCKGHHKWNRENLTAIFGATEQSRLKFKGLILDRGHGSRPCW